MSYKINALPEFVTRVKKLSKKYKNIKEDLKSLSDELQKNPKVGISLFNKCYKIRVANSSVPTGKSGGFRVIYYYIDSDENIYLMFIYSKSEYENISDEKIVEILKNNGLTS